MERPRKRSRRGTGSSRKCCPYIPVNPIKEYSLHVELPCGANVRAETGASLPHRNLVWALKSIESSLRIMYGKSKMPWDAAEKRREMRFSGQRYFLAYSSSENSSSENPPVGFLSYRIDKDERPPPEESGQIVEDKTYDLSPREYAVYVYEVFIAENARGRGLAKGLMNIVEEVCRNAGISKIILTVFESNVPALQLYKKSLGFVVADISPSRSGVLDAGYQILSKTLES